MSDNTQKKQMTELGALWKFKSAKGTTYLTGKVKTPTGEEFSVVVFANSKKEPGSKSPDYRLYLREPLQTESAKPITKKVVATKAAPKVAEDDDSELL